MAGWKFLVSTGASFIPSSESPDLLGSTTIDQPSALGRVGFRPLVPLLFQSSLVGSQDRAPLSKARAVRGLTWHGMAFRGANWRGRGFFGDILLLYELGSRIPSSSQHRVLRTLCSICLPFQPWEVYWSKVVKFPLCGQHPASQSPQHQQSRCPCEMR